MKKRNRTNQSLRRRTIWLLLLLLMLPSVTALAGNGMENKSLWTVMQSGTNTIKITVPVYDEEGLDGWVDKGYLYVTPDGGSKETVLNFYSKEKSGDRCHLFIKKAVNGNMTLTRDGGLSSGTIGTNEKDFELAHADGEKYIFYFYVEWTVPDKYRGKSLKFTWDCHKKGNRDAKDKDLSLNSTTITMSSSPSLTIPTIMDPMVAYDSDHAGQMMIVYTMSESDIISLTASYKEMNGSTYTSKTMDLDPSMVGYAYLPADKPAEDFYITARYRDYEGTERITQSDPVNLPLLHYPYALSAALQDDGTVRLQWQCKDQNYTDISTEDFWDVQRCTSGFLDGNPQWMSINQVDFSGVNNTYTYIDETFTSSYAGEPVYYRVRRTSTSLWDWKSGTYAITGLYATVHLPEVQKATVTKGTWNENQHQAKFTFSIGPKDQYDKDGRFILRSAADWETFAKLVNTDGKTSLSAIMAADIDIGKSKTMVGTNNKAYQGTFDGNGHTITVCYDTLNVEYVAPFSVVGAATIKNLHVAGKLVSKQKFVAGIIGNVKSGTANLSNCRVSALIGSTKTGDATNGGLVAVVYQNNYVKLTNCLFDGQLVGKNSHSLGGLVGYTYTNPTIDKCLFNPIVVDVAPSMTDCKSLVRYNTTNVSAPAITNSYYTIPFDGSTTMTIDGKEYFILRNEKDWLTFVDKINAANFSSDVNAIMANDISIANSAALSTRYRGNFEGNGHTLIVNITGGTRESIAPFSLVDNVNIRNLNVIGSVSGGLHTSGLIGSCSTGTNYITNCNIAVDVYCKNTHAGGIIGHGHSAKNVILNSVFRGSITYETYYDNNHWGAIMGWEDGGTSNEVRNCLENCTSFNNQSHVALCWNANNGGNYWGKNGTNWSVNGWSDSAESAKGMSTADLVSKLGSPNWEVDGNRAIPKQTKIEVSQGVDASLMPLVDLAEKLGDQWEVMGNTVQLIPEIQNDDQYATQIWVDNARVVMNIDKLVGDSIRYTERKELTKEECAEGRFEHELVTSCVDYKFNFVVEQNTALLTPVNTPGTTAVGLTDADKSFYYDSNVKIDSIAMTTNQATVTLTWDVTGQADYYRILRRDKQSDETVVLEEAYDQLTYIDQHPQPQHAYEYTIEGVTDCEGHNVSTVKVDGWCKPTGMVRGYLRLSDGTGQGGVTVTAVPADNSGAERSTVTDASGFYEIDSLIYEGTGTYYITAATSGDEGTYTQYTVTFDQYCNLVVNANLKLEDYYLLSGFVMYEGTSVPVTGASFEVDGQEVHNGSGKTIVTDTQGKFKISLSKGQHTVKVKKDGHVFMYDGYYVDALDTSKTRNNWQKSVAGHIFWDQTRVNLQGRVVGGETQGNKPLGELASVNNLGDSITIVMSLEGDNASWLVRDQLDDGLKERHNDYYFATENGDTCHMDEYRYRLVIKPSNTTGEYCVPMLPVKFKVTEIYANGYSTLFQSGKVSETLDLSDYFNGDTVVYSRIYHSAPTLDVHQYNMDGKDYLGIKNYTETDNTGKKAKVELWSEDKGYSFGYPVFMSGSGIVLTMSAQEQYYYNNDESGEPDVVLLSGGEVIVQNGLIGTTEKETLPLDSIGRYIYAFTPENLTFTEEGDMALKTLTMTLHYDGTYYDVTPINGEPIKGYVLASKGKSQGKIAVADAGTYLIDILRDPPGSHSSAYIESGTRMNYSFTQDFRLQAGIKLDLGMSMGSSNSFTGVWSGAGAGIETGSIISVSQMPVASTQILVNWYNQWQYSYTFETTERISTAGAGPNSVGADADVFIGMTQEAVMNEAVAVRAVGEETYQRLTAHSGGTFEVDGVKFSVPQGSMKLLAQGQNSKGENVYIVRDEVMSVSTRLKSTFVHSAYYIEKELIPELINVRNSLILGKGTDPDTAQVIANYNGYAVYISKVDVDDPNFATSEDYYTQVNPKGMVCSDSIAIINGKIITWVSFLAQNEKEKLMANDLVKRYAVDGRTGVNYGETYGTTENQKAYLSLPIYSGANFSFGGKSFGGGSKAGTLEYDKQGTDGVVHHTEISVFSVGLSIKLSPVANINYNYDFGKSEGYTKRVGFTLSPSLNSNLLVDVYRTNLNFFELEQKIESMKANGYTDDDLNALYFQKSAKEYIEIVKYGEGYGQSASAGGYSSFARGKDLNEYRSFVYRTRGGATVSPWEDERRTKYYHPGTLLDDKTVAIDNLKIWTDQASVSNVPFGEPARFTIHFSNDTEFPNLATPAFSVRIKDGTNPKGAKINIEGDPLTGTDETVTLAGRSEVTKVLELYPSSDFDYENIGISIIDTSDPLREQVCYISAHFVPAAGKVNIAAPGDKWVVNTESSYDSNKQQYYLPVTIDGFDVNYRNFDHIELQYKLSNKGDNDWVNVCSFYKDPDLMAKATGECKLIEDDGKIVATFWGESDPIEQEYDIRAVNFCRYENGYLTRSSNILSGIKDTRRPTLFGTPKPENGILGIGDDIMLRFSEEIAGNNLRDLNNFQVLGVTNSGNVSLSTDLRFNGQDEAITQASRNLSDKSFTVDVMVNPDKTGKDMTLFSHGNDDDFIELGLTSDWKLMALFKDAVLTSTEAIPFDGLREILYVVEPDMETETTRVTFYDGTKSIGTFTYNNLYLGMGNYSLGCHKENHGNSNNYEGEMVEFRLWNHALTMNEIGDYGKKRLTGYELGLLDNFPLNEGQGEYSYNRVGSGGDLYVHEGAWKVPNGISMTLDGSKGFAIDSQKFSRKDYENYTMMFWFRTTDANGTLLSNGPAFDEPGSKRHFNIGVEDGQIYFRSGNRQVKAAVEVNDGQWHHFAVNVNRSRNTGHLYLDMSQKGTFATDTLGGISAETIIAGATSLGGGNVEKAIKGNIDELCMFESALTAGLIRSIAYTAPTGEEMGLLAYLNFAENELQLDNSQQLVPSGFSLKRYWDSTTGKFTNERDTLVEKSVVEQFADRNNHAPMRGIAKLENIPYTFVADGKDLLINLDVPDYQIEKTNVYITVKEIADLNGNTLASPVTMDLYVYRSSLRWDTKKVSLDVDYGEEQTFEATIQNLSGRSRDFKIEGLPVWITASQTSGSIGTLGEVTITFTVSPYINVGNFDEVIYLVSSNNMSEPLPISIKVRRQNPGWQLDDELIKENYTMHVIGRVNIQNEIMYDPADRIAVFGGENQRLLGLANLSSSDGLAYLTVYNSSTKSIPLNYVFYDASTGIVHQIVPENSDAQNFQFDSVVGTPTNPVEFTPGETVIQCIPLKKGWNWISLNVQPSDTITFGNLFGNSTFLWDVGDGLEYPTGENKYTTLSFKSVSKGLNTGSSIKTWDCADQVLQFDPHIMYRFFSKSEKTAFLRGTPNVDGTMTVHPGWNRIGYISKINLPLGTALADYTDKASEGDIIKSQNEFAMLTIDALGNKAWRGTLESMRTGEGYMLKRNAKDDAEFTYPTYYSMTRYNGNGSAKQRIPLFENRSSSSMTVVAIAEGIETQEGDVLTAWRGPELCGKAVADENGMFYLNVGDVVTESSDPAVSASDELTFTIERDDELVATAPGHQMRYKANASHGTPSEPTLIRFAECDVFGGEGWYSLDGIKLQGKPTRRGVYIHNNEKVIIK